MEKNSYDVCILGAGISGLSTAAFLLDQAPDLRILILEKEEHPGGAISSFHHKGYLAEWGPHGFLDNCEETNRLVQIAGLEEERETAPLGEFVRYVCLDGELKCIPQTPLKIIRQPLISPLEKLRVLGDLVKPPLAGEPTVAQWCAHRFGKSLLPFADAVFTGTYAGDINRLKIDAVMPGVRSLEQEYGSVIRGALKRMVTNRRKNKNCRKGLPAMTSFVKGMGRLPDALASSLKSRVDLFYNQEVGSLEKSADSWKVATASQTYSSTHLVSALPVNASLALLKTLAAVPSLPVQKIPESRLATILLGFDKEAQIPYGFGYLAPEKEERFSLGTLFSSHMFPGRAPSGHQLIEVLVGGRRHPERLLLDDSQLINEVYRDLKALIPLPKAPCFSTVLRPQAGIPQLEEGYTSLLGWRETVLEQYPSLHICGFGWKGIGINDMAKEAKKATQRIINLHAPDGETEVKAIYF